MVLRGQVSQHPALCAARAAWPAIGCGTNVERRLHQLGFRGRALPEATFLCVSAKAGHRRVQVEHRPTAQLRVCNARHSSVWHACQLRASCLDTPTCVLSGSPPCAQVPAPCRRRGCADLSAPLWDFADRTRVAREYPATNQRERRGAVLEELRSDVSTCVHAGTWVSCPLRPDAPCVPVRH